MKIPRPPLLPSLALGAILAVGAGAWMIAGLGVALLAVGGLLWLDLTLAGLRKGAKP